MIKIFVMNGPDEGRVFSVEKDSVFIGRSDTNDIKLEHRSVSRKHLKITKKSGSYYVVDLNSANGTSIEGKRVAAFRETRVEGGVPIGVGKIILSLETAHPGSVSRLEEAMDLSKDLRETGKIDIRKGHRTTNRNLELIYQVSQVLLQSSDLRKILQEILNAVFEYFKTIERGLIILVDDETLEVSEVVSRVGDDKDQTVTYYSRFIVDRVLHEETAVIMSDTDSENDTDLSESMRLLKIRSVMCVPLISKSRIRGVIYVDSVDKPYGFSKEDLSFLTALSAPAAMAIENAMLHSSLEQVSTKSPKKSTSPPGN